MYDGQSIALSFDDSGSLTNRYLSGPVADQVFASEDGAGDVLWALADNQGTIRDIAAYDAVNDVTSVVNHIQYDSFGNITAETDPQTSQAPTQGSVLDGDFRFSFTGREYDPETGQYYYRHRYYDPTTGRFDSEDPSGFAAGDANLQRYVFNSPTNYTDGSGLQVGSGGGGSDGAAPYRNFRDFRFYMPINEPKAVPPNVEKAESAGVRYLLNLARKYGTDGTPSNPEGSGSSAPLSSDQSIHTYVRVHVGGLGQMNPQNVDAEAGMRYTGPPFFQGPPRKEPWSPWSAVRNIFNKFKIGK